MDTPPANGANSVIDQAAASALFRKAPTLRELMLYLWKHRDQALSEYAIATEVLGRRPDFDPKTDATVRVHVSRLRQRLRDYYETEARGAPVRIQVAQGEYRLELVEAAAEAPPPPAPAIAGVVEAVPVTAVRPMGSSARRVGWWVLGAALLLLAGDNLRLRMQGPPAPPTLDAFWETVVEKGKPIHIVVPAPLFFRWENQPFLARDFRVNRPEELVKSNQLTYLRDKFGNPEINQLYTVASDTLGASAIARYLQDRGVAASVVDTPGATVDLIGSGDTVALVGPGTTQQLGSMVERVNFYFTPGAGGVFNRTPLPGEPQHYASAQHSQLRSTNYGVIAHLPGKSPGTQLLIIASSYNPALVAMLTTRGELEMIRAWLKRENQPQFFELVVEYERNADKIISTRPVALRPYLTR